MASPGDAAVKAVKAGIDVILDSPDSAAAARRSWRRSRPARFRARRSKRRRGACSKPRRGSACSARARSISKRCRCRVGGRKHEAVARAVSDRVDHADQGRAQPGAAATPRTGSVLYLSVLDYPVGLAHRGAEPHGDSRAEGALAEHRVDRDFGSHDAERARHGSRHGRALRRGRGRRLRARVVGSGRLDLAPQVVTAARGSVARAASGASQPFVAMFFGNPYTAMFVPEPAGDAADLRLLRLRGAVGGAALAGEIRDWRQAADRAAGTVPARPRASPRTLAEHVGLRLGVDVLFPRQQLLTEAPDDGRCCGAAHPRARRGPCARRTA